MDASTSSAVSPELDFRRQRRVINSLTILLQYDMSQVYASPYTSPYFTAKILIRTLVRLLIIRRFQQSDSTLGGLHRPSFVFLRPIIGF